MQIKGVGLLKIAAFFLACGLIFAQAPTVIQGPDVVSTSRVVINQNFANLYSASPVSVKQFGAIGNGSDDSVAFQAAADAVSSVGGGSVLIPPSSGCYGIGSSVLVHSNTTFYSTAQSTCVQKRNGPTDQVFRTDSTTPTSNVHWINFTIDGNRSAMTGIVGDGGNFGIICSGCSNSSIESMLIENSYTDGISIDCWGADTAHHTNTGNGFTVLNTRVTNSRRNGGSQSCGLNTRIINSKFDSTNGTNPETGFDLEPFLAGQISTGFTVLNTEFTGNNSHGLFINYTGLTDPAGNFTLNSQSHGNCVSTVSACAELYAVASSTITGLSITGNYTSTSSSSTSSLILNGGFTNVMIDVISSGSARGLLMQNVNTNVTISGLYSGSSNDLVVDSTNVNVAPLASLILTHNTVQAGGYALQFPLSGIPANFSDKGITYWSTSSPRTGAMNVSSHVVINDSSTNPALAIGDGSGHGATEAVINNSGIFALFASTGAIPACISANSLSATNSFCVDSTGHLIFTGLVSYASNAAAASAGVPVGGVYTVTASNPFQLAVRF